MENIETGRKTADPQNNVPFWKTNSARILLALAVGLGAGMLTAGSSGGWIDQTIVIADFVGTAWLNALKMTVIPLVVALLITGIVQTAEAARAGRITARAIAWFIVILWTSTIFAAFYVPAVLAFFPMPVDSAASLRNALQGAENVGEVPGFADFFKSLIPTNVFDAAARDAILPMIIFTTIFAFAITRIAPEFRQILSRFFAAITDAMVVMIHWILAIAPIGVFALAYVVAAKTGATAIGALIHYILVVSSVGIIVWGAAYGVALFAGRIALGKFARAALPSQAVAISTQSSLASLPVMLRSTEMLGLRPQIGEVVLPLAVALFRATGPGMNLAVAIYVAHWYGIELSTAQIAAGVFVAAVTTMGSVSLPGTVSFVSAIAPICIAMGLPVAPLAILIAVETIPDIFRTVGNVTMDIAVTAVVDRRSSDDLLPVRIEE